MATPPAYDPAKSLRRIYRAASARLLRAIARTVRAALLGDDLARLRAERQLRAETQAVVDDLNAAVPVAVVAVLIAAQALGEDRGKADQRRSPRVRTLARYALREIERIHAARRGQPIPPPLPRPAHIPPAGALPRRSDPATLPLDTVRDPADDGPLRDALAELALDAPADDPDVPDEDSLDDDAGLDLDVDDLADDDLDVFDEVPDDPAGDDALTEALQVIADDDPIADPDEPVDEPEPERTPAELDRDEALDEAFREVARRTPPPDLPDDPPAPPPPADEPGQPANDEPRQPTADDRLRDPITTIAEARIRGELDGRIEAAHGAILRQVDDIYRRVIGEAALTEPAQDGTRRLRAAQRAMDRFADRGVVEFVDERGRRWNMQSYVEMAVRTAALRSLTDAHMAWLTDTGVDLVYVTRVAGQCALCRPWEGEVLSVLPLEDGPVETTSLDYDRETVIPHTVTRTVGDAIAAGVQHPNCRHRFLALYPGNTTVPPATPDPEAYADQQELRRLERQVRRWRTREAAALSPEMTRAARLKVRAWQAEIRRHVDTTGVRRLRGREAIDRALPSPTPRARPVDAQQP